MFESAGQFFDTLLVLATAATDAAPDAASGATDDTAAVLKQAVEALPGGDDELIKSLIIGIPIGLGLAAATGFRIFIPLLALSIGMQHSPDLANTVGSGFEWVGSPIATIIFGAAALFEVGGYYIPWVDNLLDTIATPAAAIAGTAAVAAVLGDIDPSIKWTLALIAGGGVAGTVQFFTTGTRAVSTATTAGVGNPVVSTAEAGGAIVFSVLALVASVVAGVLALFLVIWLLKKVFFRRKPRATANAMPA